eukprot:symbB.v1.2.031068.t1/scaffold3568.1/size55461/5
MDDEPLLKRFKVSREGTGHAQVKIEHYFTDEQVSKVIAGAVELPSEAGNISLVDADGDQVLMSFKSLKSDVEYTVHHHPPKTSALPDPKCETIEVPKLNELKSGELLDVSSFKQLLAPNTEADRPIFLREHLMDVHKVAMDVLKSEGQEKRLVSLVGYEIGKLHNFDIPQGDQGHKQRNTLLAFRPRGTECFTEGISGAQPIHRSEYVMHCIKHFQKANFQQVKQMYEMLLPRNAGAAGTAFEMLVQLFWSDVIHKKCEVELTLDWRDEGATPKQTIKIHGNAIQYQPNKIEVYDHQDADDDAVQMLKGYFTPNTFHYPVLDSILRYEQEGQMKVLAIQVSIGQTHEHSEPRKNALLEKKVEGMPKPKLALWDFPVKGPKERKCQWKNSPSEHWDLTYVQCKKFEEWFEFGHLCD